MLFRSLDVVTLTGRRRAGPTPEGAVIRLYKNNRDGTFRDVTAGSGLGRSVWAAGIAAEIGDFHLRNWLKDRLKEDGHWGAVRAVNTSCMDVCARGLVTVCIEPAGGEPSVVVVDPVADRDELYRAKIGRAHV